MNDRFFLDTNIFVYSLDRNAPAKAQKASRLIRQALSTRKGVVSYQVVQEFLNVVLKHSAQPIKTVDAERYLATVFRPLLGVESSSALFSSALQIHSGSGFSWYDSLIIGAAIRAHCDLLYSEDMQHGRKIGGLTIENPFL
jgi:predicted nucleic acid-binding protein